MQREKGAERQTEDSMICIAEEVWSNTAKGDEPGANNNYHQDKMYDNPPLQSFKK